MLGIVVMVLILSLGLMLASIWIYDCIEKTYEDYYYESEEDLEEYWGMG